MTKMATIVLDEFIDQPPVRVWAALTRPELIARWWAPGNVSAEPGHRFTLDMGKWGQQPCEVVASDPERMISYTFSKWMTITWRIQAEGEGTRLTLEHSGFDLDTPLGRQAYDGMGAGWPAILKRISGALQAQAV
ncbi:SRPBCC family protein [Aminobacter sp. MET-1]|uniref:SRPBCC family protein n=1 Tax=Aminobacter sp. MET-1 TaxID=2951085 RepID=UPI00226A5DB3|nr:SRPBCC domain-containing protein [Aminobacter sp. MET-1]MCX8571252.1 SRPBCC domain-containing protein [Aminobacter sp. MET-1]